MKKFWVILSILGIASFTTTQAQALPLIINGGFETGDFTGWDINSFINDIHAGSFFIDDNDGLTPISSLYLPAPSTVGPAEGLFYAISDQEGPTLTALSQIFTVPEFSSNVQLSFDMFVNDWNEQGAIIHPDGLVMEDTLTRSVANQHARVDLLSAGADPFDTGTAVLQNFYLGVDDGENPHDYTHYEFDITSITGVGGDFSLRFAEVDTEFFLNLGVDNVSITADTGTAPQDVIPEPMSILLLGFGLLGAAGLRKKQI